MENQYLIQDQVPPVSYLGDFRLSGESLDHMYDLL